tara:strand:+ start:44195 stop:44770 length:576 start_codon:yes stop_codon:yes gene_type:complete
MARSNTGNTGLNQQLVTVTPNTWTDLLPRDSARTNFLKGVTFNKIVIQNTGAADITVSVKLISRLPESPNTEFEGEIVSDKIISGSTRRSSNGISAGKNNIVMFSHVMSPSVQGYGNGGHDANTISDWTGLTYTGQIEIDFINYQLEFPDVQSVQFKSNVASGFIATLVLNKNVQRIRMPAGSNGMKQNLM